MVSPNPSIISYFQFLTGRCYKKANFLGRISCLVRVWRPVGLSRYTMSTITDTSATQVPLEMRLHVVAYRWCSIRYYGHGYPGEQYFAPKEMAGLSCCARRGVSDPRLVRFLVIFGRPIAPISYTLLYRISLFLICQFLVAWLKSSTIS